MNPSDVPPPALDHATPRHAATRPAELSEAARVSESTETERVAIARGEAIERDGALATIDYASPPPPPAPPPRPTIAVCAAAAVVAAAGVLAIAAFAPEAIADARRGRLLGSFGALPTLIGVGLLATEGLAVIGRSAACATLIAVPALAAAGFVAVVGAILTHQRPAGWDAQRETPQAIVVVCALAFVGVAHEHWRRRLEAHARRHGNPTPPRPRRDWGPR